ncbi:syndecan-1 [Latimeria chalumnae]|uniref:syndecan-1 n=1 Tax=Latimeria chalumnae TaxID=7897 RepID=UPI0003C16BB2|nr:PREDICTED: syndecan-1 [Latimeria chalumnae]|eukprot:XP_006001159.1 PREDICTED: syndecan-1 [Latimeria chalumnae]
MRIANISIAVCLLALFFPAAYLESSASEHPHPEDMDGSGGDDEDWSSGSGFSGDEVFSVSLESTTELTSSVPSTSTTFIFNQSDLKHKMQTVAAATQSSPASSTEGEAETSPTVNILENKGSSVLSTVQQSVKMSSVAQTTVASYTSPRISTTIEETMNAVDLYHKQGRSMFRHVNVSTTTSSADANVTVAHEADATAIAVEPTVIVNEGLATVTTKVLEGSGEMGDMYFVDPIVEFKNNSAGLESIPGNYEISETVADRGTSDAFQGLLENQNVLAGVITGGIVGLLLAVVLLVLMVYRMKKKDEGSYSLDEPKQSNGGYQKPQKQEEFFA